MQDIIFQYIQEWEQTNWNFILLKKWNIKSIPLSGELLIKLCLEVKLGFTVVSIFEQEKDYALNCLSKNPE